MSFAAARDLFVVRDGLESVLRLERLLGVLQHLLLRHRGPVEGDVVLLRQVGPVGAGRPNRVRLVHVVRHLRALRTGDVPYV